MPEAYITATGRCLPGPPVPNDEIDSYLGTVGKHDEVLKKATLANCGIVNRHYGINTKQESQVTLAGMAASAVREALGRSAVSLDDIDYLAAGTSIPDLVMPGMASLVHAELRGGPCEIISTAGVCSAGMMALKSAYLNIRSGEKRTAVVTAGEFPSRVLKSSRYAEQAAPAAEGGQGLTKEMAFLRYMLSDGTGAALVQDRPAPQGVSLRINWISLVSHASSGPTCMQLGTGPRDDGKSSWWDYPTASDASAAGALAMRQNLALLPHMVRIVVADYARLAGEGRFDPASVTWYAAHYSSERLKRSMLKEMAVQGVDTMPAERWYSNLTRVGNIGSAAIFVILDELLTTGRVSAGDQILCMVPESGRFTVSHMLLTAVGPDHIAS
ncbi:3-oxoacyl-[acyl-carrier-protein] synthase III C-terminal domain-containing protein [Streptomyces lavendulae]|uniref:3-oxoacyl-[acyl-carrier-protein] synthase III C-terminal domain-containing protein n=1 Tax=Streptomyces lavendulae TaxID=1914 RepID=UPI00380E7FC0